MKGFVQDIEGNAVKNEEFRPPAWQNKRLKAAWDQDYLLTVLATLSSWQGYACLNRLTALQVVPSSIVHALHEQVHPPLGYQPASALDLNHQLVVVRSQATRATLAYPPPLLVLSPISQPVQRPPSLMFPLFALKTNFDAIALPIHPTHD